LARLDARAKALGVSRNRLITVAIEASLSSAAEWPPELVRMLGQPLDASSADLLGDSLSHVRRARKNRRRAPRL
jgi:hypothetical protein